MCGGSEDGAAADGEHGGVEAEDEAVAGGGDEWFAEAELCEGVVSGGSSSVSLCNG